MLICVCTVEGKSLPEHLTGMIMLRRTRRYTRFWSTWNLLDVINSFKRYPTFHTDLSYNHWISTLHHLHSCMPSNIFVSLSTFRLPPSSEMFLTKQGKHAWVSQNNMSDFNIAANCVSRSFKDSLLIWAINWRDEISSCKWILIFNFWGRKNPKCNIGHEISCCLPSAQDESKRHFCLFFCLSIHDLYAEKMCFGKC